MATGQNTESEPMAVYGDAAYGAGELLSRLDAAGATAMVRVQPPVNAGGRFTKSDFVIDLDGRTVQCPNGIAVDIAPLKDGAGFARFEDACGVRPLQMHCTTAKTGRQISIGPHEALLARERERQRDPAWRTEYRQTRPKVERKLSHMMFRRHGGRRARVRGRVRVAQDFSWLGAARNLARLATLRVASGSGGWAVVTG